MKKVKKKKRTIYMNNVVHSASKFGCTVNDTVIFSQLF